MRPEAAASLATPLSLSMRSARQHWPAVVLIATCALLPSGAVAEGDQARLGALRREIHETLKAIEKDGNNLQAARAQIESLGRDIEAAAARQRELEQHIARKTTSVAQLTQRQGARKSAHEAVLAQLHRQSLNRYALLVQPRLKLLLNQSDAHRLGRSLAYFDYLTAQYRRGVESASSAKLALEQTAAALKLETAALRILRKQTADHLAGLRDTQSRHATLIAAIEGRVDVSEARVRSLREDESQLLALINQLGRDTDATANANEFAALEGKLDWPIAGDIANLAGGTLREGGAQWAGVLISADDGSEVRAVSAGRVVFADWFRNLGQLVILDHGEGYMTLYGNAAELKVQADETVAAGTVIAIVGAATGELPAGLYFELRADGEPLDPRRWCVAR